MTGASVCLPLSKAMDWVCALMLSYAAICTGLPTLGHPAFHGSEVFMDDPSKSLKFLWMAWRLSNGEKVLESRECFVEYSQPWAGDCLGLSNSGLDWETGQAYIKGLCLILGVIP